MLERSSAGKATSRSKRSRSLRIHLDAALRIWWRACEPRPFGRPWRIRGSARGQPESAPAHVPGGAPPGVASSARPRSSDHGPPAFFSIQLQLGVGTVVRVLRADPRGTGLPKPLIVNPGAGDVSEGLRRLPGTPPKPSGFGSQGYIPYSLMDELLERLARGKSRLGRVQGIAAINLRWFPGPAP
jgi:hypothetical protein